MSVRLRLETLMYRGHTLEQCLSGGLFFFSDSQYIRGVCSNNTSSYLLNHYAQRGISLGNIVHIVLKQYSHISYILAEFNFFGDRCIGYFNLLSTKRFVIVKVYYIEGIYIRKSQVYYDHNYYSTTLWLIPHTRFWHTLHVTRHSRECVIIQIGLMDHLPNDVYQRLRGKYMAMIHFNSNEKSRYSRFSVVHTSNINASKFYHCQRFRIDVDTKLEHTELRPILPSAMAEIWQGEAYNMKVAMPKPLSQLLHNVYHSERRCYCAIVLSQWNRRLSSWFLPSCSAPRFMWQCHAFGTTTWQCSFSGRHYWLSETFPGTIMLLFWCHGKAKGCRMQ